MPVLILKIQTVFSVLTTIINNVLFKDVTINIYLEFSGNKIVVAIILVHR